MALQLSKLDSTIPQQWLEFSPNSCRTFIEPVRTTLRTLGIFNADDKAFNAFCGVPRYFHPNADAEVLAISLELISWYFYFDDPIDQGKRAGEADDLVQRMLDVLNRGVVRSDASGCERLCLRFRQRSKWLAGSENVKAWQRFITGCSDWVESIIPLNRQGNRALPSLNEYRKIRLLNVGIIPEFAFNELGEGLALTSAFLARSDVRRFENLAALVIAYFNDVYSYEKERACRIQLNSLQLRQSLNHLDLESAFDEQLVDIRLMFEEMQRIEANLLQHGELGFSSPTDSAEMAYRRRNQSRYFFGIRAIVVGNHLWSHFDGRYYSPSSPFLELRERRQDRRRRANTARPTDRAASGTSLQL